jgi:hypothetical protein
MAGDMGINLPSSSVLFSRILCVCVGVWVGAVICIRGHFVSVDAFVSYVLFCRELQLIEFSSSAMNQAPTTTDSLLLKVPIWYLSIRPVLSLYIHVSPFNAPEDNAG